MSRSGHRDTTVRFAPAMTRTLRSAMNPLMLQAVWTATWRLPVRDAVTFAMSVSVPAPTEIISRSWPTSATARSTVSSSARTVPVPSWMTGQSPSCAASRSTTGPAGVRTGRRR